MQPNGFDTPEIQLAIQAVREASRLVRRIQSEMVTPALTKEDRSPVTVADFAAQAVVSRMLHDHFPDAVLVGEEDASDLRAPESKAALDDVTRYVTQIFPKATSDDVCEWIDAGGADPADEFWTLDPIDGTKGFLRGEQYAVAFARIVDGKVAEGVLGCPNLTAAHVPDVGGPGSLVIARRGHGTWWTPLEAEEFNQLQVSDRTESSQTRLLRSVESGHTNTGQIGEVVAALGITAEPVCLDSQAKYAVLAAGAGDGLLRLLSSKRPDYREKIWDQAAGSIVVEEAGGRVSDLSGTSLDFSQGRTLAKNRGICASNGHLHGAMIDALRKVNA